MYADDADAVDPGGAVAWRPWGEAAFAAARRTDRPVLLSLAAHWCDRCREMDAETYADPDLAAAVEERFVPVRVDVDRRPRVRERYAMGGFPSTVFLTPDGEVLSGATYLGPEGFRQVVERVGETWDARGADAGRVPRALRGRGTPAGEDIAAVERHLVARLAAEYDDEHAGWGREPKFPLPDAVEFALKRDRDRAVTTLDAIRAHLFDDYDGGFFRYAAGRGWSDPAREKLLDDNAALVRAYASAYLATGAERFREPAERTLDYLVTTLWTGEAFGGSQAPGDYYERPPEERTPADEPAVDPTAFADRNALAAEACCRLYAYTDDGTARRYAERTLDYLGDVLVADGVVTHHDADDPASCLLVDQARVARAFAVAAQTLDPAYLGTARAVADVALDRLRDDDAFVDGPVEEVGLLDRPLEPIDGNAAMANALVDLHHLTGENRYAAAARGAVAAFAGAADRLGVRVAAYGTAAARVDHPPLRIDVATPPGTDLHRAALRMADHEKVVVPDAVERDSAYEPGRAYVVADGVSDPATTPEELADAVAASVS